MQDNSTYRFEFRGTLEIPEYVLSENRSGPLSKALAICDEYGCQILLRDPHEPRSERGWVKPGGRYALTDAQPSAAQAVQ